MRGKVSAIIITSIIALSSTAAAQNRIWKSPNEGVSYFIGRWSMSIQPYPHQEVIGDDAYLVVEGSVPLDDLVINEDKTYEWKIDGMLFKGNWREAEERELHIDKLPGIVLLNGSEHSDWIVTETADVCSNKRLDVDKAWCDEYVGGVSAIDEVNLRPVGWGAPSFDGRRTKPR